jgi:hypothetical protein
MGLIRDTLAGIGCLTVVAAGAVALYQYRTPLGRLAKRTIAQYGEADTVRATGYPSAEALRRARQKEADLTWSGGPSRVTVTADEMAALVHDGLDPAARAALDSLRVTLAPGRFALEARVRTDRLGRDVLGPLSGVLDEWEPLRMSGPASLADTGRVAWRPDEFQVRAFPFPGLAGAPGGERAHRRP